MPPICLHMVLAQEAASRWEHPDIQNNMGSYLFGATAPDTRLISGVDRDDTHFYNLDGDDSQDGVAELLRRYPELTQASRLNETTRAFVAGYFSHLIADELWIGDIYRPFFGRSSPWGADPLANIMDRALQFELDRKERLNAANMTRIRDYLAAIDMHIQVGFLSMIHLEQWRDFVIGATLRDPGWEGFVRFAERYLLAQQRVTPHQWELFLASPEVFWERSISHVPQERLETFRENSIVRSAEQLRQYLEGC